MPYSKTTSAGKADRGNGTHDEQSRLDDAMRHQRYNDALFKETTGKDLDTLWAEFLQSQ